ncbi:hypothetical protein [Stigmatella erecta]|uniref:Transposase n=1 Tax=Stigmatella erecta TaxID=83460 RepID=A0A1I0IXI5_9BACT|nr:hypothetical protein [Stigmatella erecta]SEU01394.1 hypothetical protein SAMN05443639_106321 [Stigmatella erecta]
MLDEAVRENLATWLAEASEVGRGLPRYVEREFAKYLECGVLAHGFARVRCLTFNRPPIFLMLKARVLGRSFPLG